MPERSFFRPSDAPPVQRLVLPVPPTANDYWRHVGERVLRAKEADEYAAEVARTLLRTSIVPIQGEVALRLVWYREARRGDLDNRTKQLFDALQGHLYRNDSQIGDFRFSSELSDRPRIELLGARRRTPEARQILSMEMGGAR